jgi:hypothetical protein
VLAFEEERDNRAGCNCLTTPDGEPLTGFRMLRFVAYAAVGAVGAMAVAELMRRILNGS